MTKEGRSNNQVKPLGRKTLCQTLVPSHVPNHAMHQRADNRRSCLPSPQLGAILGSPLSSGLLIVAHGPLPLLSFPTAFIIRMANQTRTALLLLPLALLLAVATAWTIPTPLQRPQVRTGKGRL